MTITEHAPVVKAEAAPVSPWRRWLGPVTFAVFGLVDIFVFGLFAHHGDVTFAFSQPFAKVSIPNLSLPAAETCYACGALTLVLAALRAVVKLSTLWRRVSIAVVVFLFVAGPALLGGGRPDHRVQRGEPAAGHAQPVHPDHAGRAHRRDLLAVRGGEHRHRGPAAARRVRRRHGGQRLRLAVAGPDRGAAAGCAGRCAARGLRHPVHRRPDHPRRGPEPPHPRPHRVPVRRPDGALRQHAELPADLQRDQDPAAGRHPDHRAGVLPGDDLPLPDLPGSGPGPGGPVQHPVGAAHPRRRRAPGRGGHRRHPGVSPPGTATSSRPGCWPASAAPT